MVYLIKYTTSLKKHMRKKKHLPLTKKIYIEGFPPPQNRKHKAKSEVAACKTDQQPLRYPTQSTLITSTRSFPHQHCVYWCQAGKKENLRGFLLLGTLMHGARTLPKGCSGTINCFRQLRPSEQKALLSEGHLEITSPCCLWDGKRHPIIYLL